MLDIIASENFCKNVLLAASVAKNPVIPLILITPRIARRLEGQGPQALLLFRDFPEDRSGEWFATVKNERRLQWR